jgi:hypothetical protein
LVPQQQITVRREFSIEGPIYAIRDEKTQIIENAKVYSQGNAAKGKACG